MVDQTARLTPRQVEVFNILQRYIGEHGDSPTLQELKGLIGASSIRSVTQYLEALEKKGLLSRSRYQNRGIKLIRTQSMRANTITLPMVGNAGCDNLAIYADQHPDEFVTVDREFIHGLDPKRLVIVRAIGNSMVDAGIKDGDMVVTELDADVSEGEKVVAIINEMAVIKKITFTDNAVVLKPMSPDPHYRPIIMREDFKVEGRVIDIIRNSKKDLEYVYEPIS